MRASLGTSRSMPIHTDRPTRSIFKWPSIIITTQSNRTVGGLKSSWRGGLKFSFDHLARCPSFSAGNFSEKDRLACCKMPREIKEIKDFLLKARRKDAKSVKIKKNAENVKFKVRCSRFLYTLVITDKEKAEKLKQSLPPGLQVKELK
ncbi:hypothetical protein TCAL_02909 [Tigriopus californicus]|uniref:Large ribosomal subunit protein eL38 n=1 Tax=Tigriopus californicus TaxID=6832 RepID=A0A553NQQ5_TIGCA|nr:uncharacterized protein LOC131879650 [Tigriopus californicus]TRY67740.1 hypothetical protein TCAL_02909 [Tigriopus californicus]